jgi:hypothetical protein
MHVVTVPRLLPFVDDGRKLISVRPVAGCHFLAHRARRQQTKEGADEPEKPRAINMFSRHGDSPTTDHHCAETGSFKHGRLVERVGLWQAAMPEV